jgi:para-nitrobenzyl esterase
VIGCNKDEMNFQLPPGADLDAVKGILPQDVDDVGRIVDVMAASCDGLAVRAQGQLRAELLVEGYRRLQPQRSLSDLLNFLRSELLFRISATRMAEAQMVGSGQPVHVYLFEWGSAAHGLEVPFVFDNLAANPLGVDLTLVPGAEQLADAMSGSWVSFARTGDPSHPLIGEWPAYSIEQRPTMVFGDTCHIEHDPLGAERELWHGVPLGNRTLLESQRLDFGIAI